MSALRPECRSSTGESLPTEYALRLVLAEVSRRRSLAHGALDVGDKHCAMGCFWADHPGVSVNTHLLDKVATFNDLTPKATPKARWKRMMQWLRKRVKRNDF
jgi:hypothetical protein